MGTEAVTCVVLNWNGGKETLDCLRSVLASEGVETNILVVDNGSTDGSDREIARNFPQVTLLKNSSNVGVAAAWNQAMRWARQHNSAFLFFINSDATVEKDCLILLKEALLSNPYVAMVTPRILDGRTPNVVWYDGGYFNFFGDPVHAKTVKDDTIRAEDFATGCALLMRSEVSDKIGMFDETFFAYSEDADLSMRATKAGFTILHIPNAIATHYPSTPTIRNEGKWFRDYYVTRNKLLLVQRHVSGLRWTLFLLYFAFKYVMIPILYFTLTGQFKRIAGVGAGIRDFITGRFGMRYS